MFEKRIIIGSVLGFIASVIGLVAIFFPDLFNLQKKQIEEINMEIRNHEDTKKFQAFVNKKAFEEKDKKIFKIDVMFCASTTSSSGMADPYVEISGKEVFVNDDEICSVDEMNKERADGIPTIIHCSGYKYHFGNDESNLGSSVVNYRDAHGRCDSKDGDDVMDSGSWRVKGYAYFEDSECCHFGIHDVVFKAVDGKDVLLKDY